MIKYIEETTVDGDTVTINVMQISAVESCGGNTKVFTTGDGFHFLRTNYYNVLTAIANPKTIGGI